MLPFAPITQLGLLKNDPLGNAFSLSRITTLSVETAPSATISILRAGFALESLNLPN